MRMPGESDWEGSIRAEGGGREGLDTREVRDTLAGTGQSLSCSFRSLGISTGPESFQRIILKAGYGHR